MPPAEAEYTELSSNGENDSEDEEFDLTGGLKATLTWHTGDKQLSLGVRQFVQTQRKVEFMYKGHLNTSTGDYRMQGHLLKNFHTNTFSLENVLTAARLQQVRQRMSAQGNSKADIQQVTAKLRELNVDPDALLPGGLRPLLLTDWLIAPGLTYDSARQGAGIHPALVIKKAPQVLIHSPRTNLLLSGKVALEVDPRGAQVIARAGLRMKLFKFNITNKQDIKVSVGLDAATTPLLVHGPKDKPLHQAPYLKISENNTSVKLQAGRWTIQYAL